MCSVLANLVTRAQNQAPVNTDTSFRVGPSLVRISVSVSENDGHVAVRQLHITPATPDAALLALRICETLIRIAREEAAAQRKAEYGFAHPYIPLLQIGCECQLKHCPCRRVLSDVGVHLGMEYDCFCASSNRTTPRRDGLLHEPTCTSTVMCAYQD